MAFSSFTQTKLTHRAGSLNPNRRFVQGELPLPIFAVNNDNGSLNFSDNGAGGRFIRISATSVAYQPANRTQSVTITAFDGGTTMHLSLTVIGTFPLYPQKGYEIEGDQETKDKRARDGTLYQAEIGKPFIIWKVGMDRRLFDEAKEVWDFLMFHRKVKQFWVYDQERKLMNLVRRTSPIPQKFEGANSWSQSVIMRGDYLPTILSESGLSVIKINCGGDQDGEYAADAFYLNGSLWSFEGSPVIDSIPDSPGDTVLKTCRYDPVEVQYKITGLVASATYTIRTFFFRYGNTSTIQLTFNGVAGSSVVIPNGTSAYNSVNRAANANGEITILITRTAGPNALISGISLVKV